jgi:hypothetical protein
MHARPACWLTWVLVALKTFSFFGALTLTGMTKLLGLACGQHIVHSMSGMLRPMHPMRSPC